MFKQTNQLLERMDRFIKEVNKSNKSKYKMTILSKYKDLKDLIRYVYDPSITYGITSGSYKKYVCRSQKKAPTKHTIELSNEHHITKHTRIYELLDLLCGRALTGHEALESLCQFINIHPKYESVILSIIDKNLKIRMNTKQINKVFRGLIKEFGVVLSEKYSKDFIDKKHNYYVSRKLDGIRCICQFGSSGIKFYSRTGHEFVDKNKRSTLLSLNKHMFEAFSNTNSAHLYEKPKHQIDDMSDPIYFDGELCVLDPDGKENFTSIVSSIRKGTIDPRYYIFDVLTKREFEDRTSKSIYSERYEKLVRMYKPNKNVKILDQYPFSDLPKMMIKMSKYGWEGLMIRKDTTYKGRRTKDLLKLKKFNDAEFKVLGIKKGPFRIIGSDGLETTINTMTSVIIDYGNTKVGSGFSIKERNHFCKHPEKIIGKLITVQYFEKTAHSLRFPVFKGIRDYE